MAMNRQCMMIRHHLSEGMTESGVAEMYEAGFYLENGIGQRCAKPKTFEKP